MQSPFLEDEVVPPPLDPEEETADVAGLDVHRDVEVKADAALGDGLDPASLGPEIGGNQ